MRSHVPLLVDSQIFRYCKEGSGAVAYSTWTTPWSELWSKSFQLRTTALSNTRSILTLFGGAIDGIINISSVSIPPADMWARESLPSSRYSIPGPGLRSVTEAMDSRGFALYAL